jgi:hypothetical protein
MYIVKKVKIGGLKKQEVIMNRKYSVNSKNGPNHPRNRSIVVGEDKKKYIMSANYSHSPQYGGKEVGYDIYGSKVYLVLGEAKMISLENQEDANNYANEFERKNKDYDITDNDKELYKRTSEIILDTAKKNGVKNPKMVIQKDVPIKEFTAVLRKGDLFKD